jgi:hypothetical protein
MRHRLRGRPAALALALAFAFAFAFAAPLCAATVAHAKKTTGSKKPLPSDATLTVQAPSTAIVFPETKLTGAPSYVLAGDLGDWSVTDTAGSKTGWQVTVEAADPVAFDTGLPIEDAVMRMKVPVPHGQPRATLKNPDADGFVAVSGETAPDGVVVATTSKGKQGTLLMTQPGADDLTLTMPVDTRATRYDATVTFTVSPAL